MNQTSSSSVADQLPAAEVREYLMGLQTRITEALEAIEGEGGARFWPTPGTRSRAKSCKATASPRSWRAGACSSAQAAVSRMCAGRSCRLRPHSTGPSWRGAVRGHGRVAGVSPAQSLVPTVHMNVRMISAGHEGQPKTCWFGGGMDLTPVYGFEEDAVHFHQTCRDALAPFGEQLYPRFKQWCDEYFFLKHRNEQRGIGGIFFDDFSELGQQQSFAMLRSVGDAFLKAYLPIVERRRNAPYTQQQVDFQRYRRGRYVEFNLVWDRGTHFGLQSGGRTESILLSMPPHADWSYQREDAPGTPERDLLDKFLIRRDWL
jgi:coproporphyrinogen III oxidase